MSSWKKAIGITAILAGMIILYVGIADALGGVYGCSRLLGCSFPDSPVDFGGSASFLIAAGVGTIGFGIYLLVPKDDG